MTPLDTQLFDHFPEPVLFLAQEQVAYCNPAAQRLLLCNVSAPLPQPLAELVLHITAPGTAQCTLNGNDYDLSLQWAGDALLLMFRPIPEVNLPQLQRLSLQLRQDATSLAAALQQSPTDSDHRQDRYQAMANQSLYRMLRLTDHLDLCHQPEAGLFRPQLMDLSDFCYQLTLQIDSVSREANWRVVFENSCGSLPIRADASLLTRLLLTLCSNAMKAQPEGGQLFFSLTKSNGTARLTLQSASGHPIDFDQLFGQHHQSPTTDPAKGLGLGLPMARRIARLHQGALILDSNSNGALRCTLSLPLRVSHDGLPLRAPSTDATGGLHPLLVELADVLPYTCYRTKDLD